MANWDTFAKAINDAAAKAGAVWLSFISFLTLLFITTGSVNDRQLLLETPLKLPFIDVKLSLVGYFVTAPLFFLIYHFYTLLQLEGLARKAYAFDGQLRATVQAPEERRLVRQQLDISPFVQLIAGVSERRIGVIGWSNLLIAWTTLVLLPITLLLMTQLIFLPYHLQDVTWLHRCVILADLTIIAIFWKRICQIPVAPSLSSQALSASVWLRKTVGLKRSSTIFRTAIERASTIVENRSPRARLSGTRLAAICVGVFSLFVAVSPTEMHYAATHPVTDYFFNVSLDRLDGRLTTRSGFTNKLFLDGDDLQSGVRDGETSNPPKKLSFRGRNLYGAVLSRTNLSGADFTAAVLTEASLEESNLQGARFGCIGDVELNSGEDRPHRIHNEKTRCTNLDRAGLWAAKLQNAVLDGSSLEGARLREANLCNASLRDINAPGIHLDMADMRGANFELARLPGASIDRAKLQLASLSSARLTASSIIKSDLRASDLSFANLHGATLHNSRLQAATLTGTELQGAYLQDASLQTAQLKSTFVYRAETEDATVAQNFIADLDTWTIPHFPPTFKHAMISVRFDISTYTSFVEANLRGIHDTGARERIYQELKGLAPSNVSASKLIEDERWWAAHSRLPLNQEDYSRVAATSVVEVICEQDSSSFLNVKLLEKKLQDIAGYSHVGVELKKRLDAKSCTEFANLAKDVQDWLQGLSVKRAAAP